MMQWYYSQPGIATTSGTPVFFHPGAGMMFGFGPWGWVAGVIWVATWILFIVALIALIRWLWRMGNK